MGLFKNSVFNETQKNYTLEHLHDVNTNTNYSLIRVFKTKLDGSMQYPFVFAPNADGTPTKSALETALDDDFIITFNAAMGASWKGPDGLLIQNGEVIQYGPTIHHPDCKPLTIDGSGNLSYAPIDADGDTLIQSGIVSAVCGFMPIIENYKAIPANEWNNIDHYTEQAQRQVMGQFGNGDYGIITCEGRGFDNSPGWTVAQTQTICTKHGLKFAYFFDGGGSVGTVINKKQLNIIYENEKGRRIPACIVFTGSTTAPPTVAPSNHGLMVSLTNATLSNKPNTFKVGSSFNTDIILNERCVLDSVVVTMKGKDITSSCLSGLNISIPKVTGKITITVYASVVEEPEYTEVEYIESTGEQYICTPVLLKNIANRKTRIETEVQFLANGNTRQLIGGNPVFYFGINNGKYECNGSVGTVPYSANSFDKIVHTTEADGSANVTAALYVNDNLAASKSTNATNIGTVSFTMFSLGAGGVGVIYGSQINAKCRMKRTKVYIDDVLAGDFIPCIRNADDVVCVYDTVSKTFIENKGTGSFTCA